jgi:hypothetical protein
MPQVNLAAMEAALAAFAADGGIAAAHRVVLVVDRAGWHTEQAARAAGRADALVPARLHAATEPGGAPVTAGAGGGGKLAGEQDRGTGTDRRAALCDAAWRSGAAMSGDELPLVAVVLTRTLHRESVSFTPIPGALPGRGEWRPIGDIDDLATLRFEWTRLPPAPKRFRGVLPRRWVAEPGAPWAAFSWLGQSRRLAKEYERLGETSEAMIYATMSRLMVRRLARAQPFSDTGLPTKIPNPAPVTPPPVGSAPPRSRAPSVG